MTLFDYCVARLGGVENVPRRSRTGQTIRQRTGVSRSGELLRIAALPRRQMDPLHVQRCADEMTEKLKMPDGRMRLWPLQGFALWELERFGLFAPIAVGKGKALVSLLAPVVLQAERPLLLVPAQLRDQTIAQVIPNMRRHWRLHPDLLVVGYSELSVASGQNLLVELRPDLIIMDEAHRVANATAARTKRLDRYLHENPSCRVVSLSGTMMRKSIRKFWKLIRWSLGDPCAPLPKSWRELQDWADAIDLDVQPPENRVPPGALKMFCSTPAESVREGFRRRLVETPGVVASSSNEVPCSLLVLAKKNIIMPDVVRHHLDVLENQWETPNGDLLTEALDVWRIARQLALGFWLRWEPAAPKDWLYARKAWKSIVREQVSRNSPGLDSELLVFNAYSRGDLTCSEFGDWITVKDKFVPNTIIQWESDFAVLAAAEWLADHERGICWTENPEFGEAVSRATGRPYYGAGPWASMEILTASAPIIASQNAHREGRNLQDRFSENLLTSPPASGEIWEQVIGRTHREGQEVDEVLVEWFGFCQSQRDSFERALAEARFIEETMGARQKLLYADIVR